MLAIRSLFFTLLLPGTVTLLIPRYLLSGSEPVLHGRWGFWQGFGLVTVGLGASILFCCIWDFGVRGRGTLAPLDPPKHLVVQGLYRYVRNPMYVGVVSILLGEALLFGSIPLLVYAAVFFLCAHFFVLLYEEPVLRRQFGESYDNYRRTVHRWVPKIPASSQDGVA